MQKTGDEVDGDTSILELPTDHLADQVREAMRKSTSSTQSMGRWQEDKEPVVIDVDEDPNASFTLPPANGSSHSFRPETDFTPTFPSSSPGSISRLPRARQASSLLPRLRSSDSPSSPSSADFFIPTPSPTRTSPSTPKATPMSTRIPAVAINGDDYSLGSPPPSTSSVSTSTPARRTPNAPCATRLFTPPTPASGSRATRVLSGLMRSDTHSSNGATNPSGLVSRTLRQVMLGGNRSRDSNNTESFSKSSPSILASTPSRNSMDSRRVPALRNDIGLGRPSLEIRRGTSFDSRIRHLPNAGPLDNGRRPSVSPEPQYNSPTGGASDADSPPDAAPAYDPEPHFRPSFDSARPSFDTSSRPGSAARMRQRTPSLRVTDASGERVPAPREPLATARQRKRSMSVQERFPGPRRGEAIARPGSSASVHVARGNRRGEGEDSGGLERTPGGGRSGVLGPQWLGPRTAKAFRAAGLLDFDREQEQDRDRSADFSDATTRLRSGSVGGVPSPSPPGPGSVGTGGGGSLLTQNRFAPMRSASEYGSAHGRTHSRMAVSEAGVPTNGGYHGGRRGSGTFSAYGGSASAYGGSAYGQSGLMESPTFTSSSRERDTPKSSTSTAPTSLSESFGYAGRDRERDRDRDREEVRELKERHASEMGALLGALSDAQRTVRMLREENTQLRDRLNDFAAIRRENDVLRQACSGLEREVEGLRDACDELQHEHELAAARALRAPGGLTKSWSQGSSSSGGLRTPLAKPGNSSPLAVDTTPQFLRQGDHEEDEGYNNTVIIHDGEDRGLAFRTSRTYDDPGPSDKLAPSTAPSLKRRLSDTSSIFPVPPANMTMLLDDDGASGAEDTHRFDGEHSQMHFGKPKAAPQPHSYARSLSRSPPDGYHNHDNFARPGHHANKSVASAASISPTTANFSMTTGSPGSLFLRPEHEILLGDMESLDLGANDVDVDSATSSLDRIASRNGW